MIAHCVCNIQHDLKFPSCFWLSVYEVPRMRSGREMLFWQKRSFRYTHFYVSQPIKVVKSLATGTKSWYHLKSTIWSYSPWVISGPSTITIKICTNVKFPSPNGSTLLCWLLCSFSPILTPALVQSLLPLEITPSHLLSNHICMLLTAPRLTKLSKHSVMAFQDC